MIVSNLLQNNKNLDSAPRPDGRRERAGRTRQAIIDAAGGMIVEGILAPTAQQIADRAGVGIRSFFRHFLDMESLFLAVDGQSEFLALGADA